MLQPLNDSTMIISALASYLKDSDKGLSEIVKCFPFITFYDEGGVKKKEIMNKYFLMLTSQQFKQENEELLKYATELYLCLYVNVNDVLVRKGIGENGLIMF